MTLASLLDFGSGYDPLLVAKGIRSAREAAEFAVLGMAMQGSLPDSAAMADFTRWQISGCYNIDPSEEREVMAGVTMTSPGPLNPLLAEIQKVINEAGRALIDYGCNSLGEFILKCVDDREAAGLPPSAAALVERLSAVIPGFKDQWEEESNEGMQVVWLRKAQQIADRLYMRFGKSDPRFDFIDVNELMMDSGDVMVAMLIFKGVMKIGEELQTAIDSEIDVGGSKDVVELRAAAVEAGKRICESVNDGEGASKIAPRHLTAYLLREAEGLNLELKRHINKQTVAY